MTLAHLSSWRAAASLLVMPVAAAAQPLPEEELAVGRQVVVTGAPDGRPAVVYGAANVVVQLVFDAPLQRTDAGTVALRWTGGDVRPHPHLEDSLFVTPSKALSSGTAAPLHVALTDGGVPLVLVFRPGTVDHVLRILRRPPALDAGTTASEATLEEMLSVLASAVFGETACAPLQSLRARPRGVEQPSTKENLVLVCAAGSFNYLRLIREHPGCAVSAARLLREGREVEVALLEPAQAEQGVTRQVLAAWSPPEKADFELLLLAADGTVCERIPAVRLGPGGSP